MVIFVLCSVGVVNGFAAGPNSGIFYHVTERDGHQEVEVSTALASYIFSEDGGALRSVFLTFAPQGTAKVELVPGTTTDPDTLARRYKADILFPFSLQADGIAGEYTLVGVSKLCPAEIVVEFQGELGDLSIVRRFMIRNDPYYTINVELIINNRTTTTAQLQLTLGNRLLVGDIPSLVYIFDDLPGQARLAVGSYVTFDGLGLMDGATVFFLQPEEVVHPFEERIAVGEDKHFQHFGVVLSAVPGTSSFSFSLYAGRRRYLLMAHSGLGALDAPGPLARLIIPLVRLLGWLYSHTGNYGWAIILFTILTRVLLFPLMRKQFRSMADMQRLQPKMKQLQQRFKDDRQLLQQKSMELYRKEGVNPLSGCLPLVIQMPILILLWRTLLFAAEQIRLSPGFLWIPDLSMRDPYFILVIVTTLIMILQQRLMPMGAMAGGDGGNKQQMYMAYMMPLVMAVFFFNLPAGLWLFWLLSTVFQAGQQYYVTWEMGKARRVAVAARVVDPVDAGEAESEKDDGEADHSGD